MRAERPGNSLQPTALVHEAYIRLTGMREIDWQNRAHFFAVAAQLMRRILVDRARAQHAHKRGGLHPVITFDEALPGAAFQRSEQVIALDEALDRLARLDPRQARIVELRFFTGLTEEETAEVLAVSPRTVKREWRSARAWLYSQMGGRSNRLVGTSCFGEFCDCHQIGHDPRTLGAGQENLLTLSWTRLWTSDSRFSSAYAVVTAS